MKKNSNDNIIVIFTVFLFIVLLYFFVNMFNFKGVQAVSTISENNQDLKVLVNQNPLDLTKIIEDNREVDLKEEMTYESLDLEYTTNYINNDTLPSGTIQVSQIGINGTQDVITIKKYNGDELISEKIVASNVRKTSVDKIVEIGTGKRKK